MSDQLIRPSLKFIKAGYVLAVLLIVAAVAGHLVFFKEQVPWLPAVAVVLLLWPIDRHLKRQFTKTTIAAGKLRHEVGFLSRSTRSIQISKVQDVRVEQTLGQRMFGVGDVSIETAGESSRLTIRNIDDPQRIADGIMDASHGSAAAAP